MAFLDITGTIIYSDTYKRKVSRNYLHLAKQIRKTETKIITWPAYAEHLHGRIISGKYAKMLHARVSENIRIVYTIAVNRDKKTLIYMDILTKNEFDKLCG